MTTDGLDTQVIVVGAGPVGLMLAGELRLGGASVIVLEQRAEPTTESRASTLHARTMEILDSRGLLDAFGQLPNEPRGHFGGIPLELTLPSRYPGQWKVPQTRTEQLLQEWAKALGADIRRGWTLLDLADDGERVEVTANTPGGLTRVRAAYLVGCDGEDSTVRALTRAPFPGQPASRELLRADVADIDIPNRRFERLEGGLAIAARGGNGVTRVMVHEFGRAAPARPTDPQFTEVIDAWKRVTGEDISAGTPLWVNWFSDTNRQLTSYRHGRVLFAGDAAHQQMPIGGQALNLGLQDAFNLGWKLAIQVGPTTSAGLLDTYHRERHAVGERVLANIRAQALLLLGNQEVEPIRALLGELIAAENNRARLAGMISGLDIRYDLGQGSGDEHPMLGSRMPDTEVVTSLGSLLTSTVTTTALLRTGKGLLVAVDGFASDGDGGHGPGSEWAAHIAAWTGRVDMAPVRRDPGLQLDSADVMLIRPDGYVAWVGSDRDGARAAMLRWFGQPAQAVHGTDHSGM